MRLWTKIGATVAGMLVLGAGATASLESHHQSSNMQATPSSLVVSSSSSHRLAKKSRAKESIKDAEVKVQSNQNSSAVSRVESPASSSQVVSPQSNTSVANAQVQAPVASSQATSQAASAVSQETTSSVAMSAPVAPQAKSEDSYVDQALSQTAQASGISAEMLLVTQDGNLIQVRENHTKMAAAGMNVDSAVDPVIATYTVENGQLTPLQ